MLAILGILAGPNVFPISWSKLSQRLLAIHPCFPQAYFSFQPETLLKVLINQSHCYLDSSPDNIALCAAEATGPVLFPM